VQAHSARLVRSLTLITLDAGLAEDAAQEAFLQLHLHWRDPAMKDRVAWLYRVAIYKCRDHRRALVRAARLLERIAGAPEPEEHPAWSVEYEVLEALRTLPRRQRVAASLFYLADLSLEQIAGAMKVSEGTAKTHLFRARERLRKELGVKK